VRLFAVASLTDQVLLAKIAVEDKEASIRLQALSQVKVPEQRLLAKIAVEDVDAGLRMNAANRLTDQQLRASIAVEDKDAGVRANAAAGLSDQVLLAKIAAEDKDPRPRRVATGRQADQTLLARIAVQDNDGNVRMAAVGKLTDQSQLTTVAVEDGDPGVRAAARRRVTDPSLLAKIALEEDKRDELRAVVVKHLIAVNTSKALLPETSGWIFSAADTTTLNETVNQAERSATAVLQVTFKGGTGGGIRMSNGATARFGPSIGPTSGLTMYGVTTYPTNGATYLIFVVTFSLSMENGMWRVSGMTPSVLSAPPFTPF
jgi:hypothetical protein